MPDQTISTAKSYDIIIFVLSIAGSLVSIIATLFVKLIFAKIADMKEKMRDGFADIITRIDKVETMTDAGLGDLYSKSANNSNEIVGLRHDMDNLTKDHERNH